MTSYICMCYGSRSIFTFSFIYLFSVAWPVINRRLPVTRELKKYYYGYFTRERLVDRAFYPGGVLPEKFGRGVRRASQNPYPIYDQNLRFSLPYLWPDQKFYTLFMTWLFLLLALNEVMELTMRGWEGKGVMKKLLLLKEKPNWRLECKNRYPIYDQKAAKWLKSIPNLWPKRLKNHTLWGRTYLYSPYKGVPPPGV